ncbi:MAG: Glutamyl-tRNA(Gln) amidotransferase subunit C [Alphaproteobacteria bacterium MarineAlpha9_Bin7]|nr:MAG: Glutamyl-tRNA(Gln) amidotransferase subunit C [Alphaproteobacteria bacterium MarineAlpha9_Bin7]
MALKKEIVAQIAKLARLEVDESDLDLMCSELSQILAWVEQLEEVDIGSVPPMTSVIEMDLKFREDVVTDGNQADDVIANAPERDHHFFVVPKVIE